MLQISVPDGVKPGDKIVATTPHGVKVRLRVPPGATAGMLLTFPVTAWVGNKVG